MEELPCPDRREAITAAARLLLGGRGNPSPPASKKPRWTVHRSTRLHKRRTCGEAKRPKEIKPGPSVDGAQSLPRRSFVSKVVVADRAHGRLGGKRDRMCS